MLVCKQHYERVRKGSFSYGFEPVFLVEKNKKTTSYAGGC